MDALHAYVAIWSEPDPLRRAELLAVCWTEESEIIGPGYHFRGTRAVLDEAARHHRERLRFRAVQTSAFDQHGNWARFTIAVLDSDDNVIQEGWDVVELRPDGKIARVITFWGAIFSKVP